jgi:hypothetical protein
MRVEVIKDEDFDKKCQLVYFGDLIVLTDPLGCPKCNTSFCGTNINNGYYANNWTKGVYNTFQGTVKLTND